MRNGIFDETDDAATPLTPEEKRDLIPAHIAYRHELNEAEQENIVRGQDWALERDRDLLTQKFIMELHKRMLRDVWRWAGKFRTTPRNLGIESWLIPIELRHLLDDAKTWMECQTYSPDEIAIRFHHKLVWIHPFPNGNGRHSRLMADLIIMKMGRKRFSWGQVSLRNAGLARVRYIDALRAADGHDISRLLKFARD